MLEMRNRKVARAVPVSTHHHDIESKGLRSILKRQAPQVSIAGTPQNRALPTIDCMVSRNPGGQSPCFHFDKHKHLSVQGNQVEFVPSILRTSPISRNHSKATLADKPERGLSLTPCATGLVWSATQ